MNKILKPKRGNLNTSKITDYEEEEFPLFTEGDSMAGKSEMRSLISTVRNNTIV